MHIAILAPTHRSFISSFLPQYIEEDLPKGFNTAPWIGNIINELLKRGHIVSVISTSTPENNNNFTCSFRQNNFTWIVVPQRIHAFRNNGDKRGLIIDFYNLEQNIMVREIKKINPDIVHAHWSYEFAGAASRSNFPYLVTVHDNSFKNLYFQFKLFVFLRLLMSEKNLNKVKYASTVSPYMYKYVNGRCKHVRIIPNPVNIKLNEKEISALVKIKLDKILRPQIIVILNGWDTRKNGFKALLAFKLLLAKLPNATLNLFGVGSEMYGDAYKLAADMGLLNVNFNGLIDNKSLNEFIKDSHLLLHPSLEESFGVVLIEAMAYGVPAIGGKNSGGVPWVINDDNLLVDVKNPSDMAVKMYDILTNNTLYENLALTAYSNAINRFSTESIVDSYIEYFEEILLNVK